VCDKTAQALSEHEFTAIAESTFHYNGGVLPEQKLQIIF
jgi:hypothetical protein